MAKRKTSKTTAPVNEYDRLDQIKQIGRLEGQGLKIAAYQVRDPATGEFGPVQFHMTHDNHVLAVMSVNAAQLFTLFVLDITGERPLVPAAAEGEVVS